MGIERKKQERNQGRFKVNQGLYSLFNIDYQVLIANEFREEIKILGKKIVIKIKYKQY